jgi:hypothetical protein
VKVKLCHQALNMTQAETNTSAVALVRSDVLEEHTASIFRITRLLNLPPSQWDMTQDGQRREPLATAPTQSSLSITVPVIK